MRFTIIPVDHLVVVDDTPAFGVDISDIDPTIHAVQWDGARGEIEYLPDPDTGDRRPNFCIVDETPYLIYVERHAAKIAELEAQQGGGS